MQWVSTVQTADAFEDAVADAIAALTARLDAAPDLVMAFISPHHSTKWQALPRVLQAHWPQAHIIGCSGGGIIGDGLEVEGSPALAITAATLPDVTVRTFHWGTDDAPQEDQAPHQWAAARALPTAEPATLLLLPDPFSFPVVRALAALDQTCPQATVLGGLASGGQSPGEHALFCGDRTWHTGAVGVVLTGNLRVQTVVAQGCKPVGQPMFVTACEGRLVRQLDGFSATDLVQRTYAGLDELDRQRAREALFLGVGMGPEHQTYRRGDFLIRHIVGADPSAGTLITTSPLQPNQVVQFHVRDAASSAEDLSELLSDAHHSEPSPPSGALLFSCLGRGHGLYREPHHDSQMLRDGLDAPDLPIAGFFCNGELGPVHGQTWLHGFTSVIALFRPKH
jgi:small ligand-binding sensory domain FIST